MRSPLRPPTAAAVAGGGAALWGLAIGLGRLGDNSALTHLGTGRLILDHGIPRRDPFSFTAGGMPWTVSSWLANAAVALADRAGGGHGIQLARAVVTVALAVLAWRLTRPARVLAGRILAVTVVLAVGSGYWSERPLLLALLLFTVLVWMVEEDRANPWAVGAVLWLWVNVHGSFPLGLVYLALRLAGRAVDRAPPGRLPRILGAAAVGTLAGGVNPLGPRLLVFPFRLLARHDLLERVHEWQSPNFSDRPALALLAGGLVALVLAGRRRSWEDALPLAVFLACGCLARRNLPMASIVLAPCLARGLRGLGSVTGEGRGPATAVAAAGMAAMAVVVAAVSLDRPPYHLAGYPVEALDWMDARGLLDRRVATQDFVGNYLIALRGERARVFVDDRFDLYPARLVRDELALLDGAEGWQRRLDRYDVEVVLWERAKPLAGLLAADDGWRVVHRDQRWVVAVRAA